MFKDMFKNKKVIFMFMLVTGMFVGSTLWATMSKKPVEIEEQAISSEEEGTKTAESQAEVKEFQVEVKEESNARNEPITSTETNWKVYKDQNRRFEVKYSGELMECGEDDVCIRLSLKEGVKVLEGEIKKDIKEKEAFVRISIDEKPFVLLSGTFGGRYYFEKNPTAPILFNRVFTEEVILNTTRFTKDYWVVYGGAGSWDTVINCYTKHNNKYYTISLNYPFISGMPGAEVKLKIQGREIIKKIAKEEIVNKALNEMRNEENKYVKMFNELLSSFRFTEDK